jgi:methylglutaconyl-CoA hydratase
MSTVSIEENGPHISVLTLNRPERRNALTLDLLSELCAGIEAAEADEQRRILILRGAGKAFCAGLDLQETLVTEDAHRSAGMVARTLRALAETRLITIAQVHGAAVAGGAGLMSACDFVVAAARTKIGYPEGRRGLVAGLVMTFLRRQLRERDIRELLLMGELITAERAKEMGLVNRVVAPAELEKETTKIADAILQNAPHALVQTKRLIEELWSSSVRDDVEKALHYHTQARESDEAKEGIAAFLEKRPPSWQKA